MRKKSFFPKKDWKTYFEKFLNGENKRDGVTECEKVENQEGENCMCRIQKSEMEEALKK
jgi:hypothetical protein